jgi:Zn-dependent protease
MEILLYVVPVVLAITVHEAAHGYAARHFGDTTAERAGRITLNPFSHIDPVGTVAVPLGIYLLSAISGGGGILFGWAKPVPVNFARLRNPKADMLWVAAAGPFANFVMAVGWTAVAAFAFGSAPGTYGHALWMMSTGNYGGIAINCVLMFLNLVPIPPLDGGRIAVSLLPNKLAWRYARVEPYGFPILLLLLVSGVLGRILSPPLNLFADGLLALFGL